jgi:hypothetical protein
MSWGVEDAFPVQQQHALSESSASAVTAIVKVEKETKSTTKLVGGIPTPLKYDGLRQLG